MGSERGCDNERWWQRERRAREAADALCRPRKLSKGGIFRFVILSPKVADRGRYKGAPCHHRLQRGAWPGPEIIADLPLGRGQASLCSVCQHCTSREILADREGMMKNGQAPQEANEPGGS